ncbi:MAG: DNA-binding response regulator [Firmicutes bacterium ZCTH02-B6]|nr:MAG: DNA-binding response regulator [Firmicutes bacterium ZCTH02-B6]
MSETTNAPAPKRVLVVDDEESILELVEYHLRRAGFDVMLATTGVEGYRLATESKPDLVVLDLMLPDMDGFEVCRRIRRKSDVPVIMLTARADDVDKIVGLEIGADDYVTKPFNPRELVARVRALLRRLGQAAESESQTEQIQFGDLAVDLVRKDVRLRGQEVQLSPTEFALLSVFVQEPGRVWARDELLDKVWGEDFVGDPRVVDVYVRYLREKLGDSAAAPLWIETVRGMGYRWRGGETPS